MCTCRYTAPHCTPRHDALLPGTPREPRGAGLPISTCPPSSMSCVRFPPTRAHPSSKSRPISRESISSEEAKPVVAARREALLPPRDRAGVPSAGRVAPAGPMQRMSRSTLTCVRPADAQVHREGVCHPRGHRAERRPLVLDPQRYVALHLAPHPQRPLASDRRRPAGALIFILTMRR